MGKPPPEIRDGKTGEWLAINPEAEWTVYEEFICRLVVLIGFEAAERFIFGGRSDGTR